LELRHDRKVRQTGEAGLRPASWAAASRIIEVFATNKSDYYSCRWTKKRRADQNAINGHRCPGDRMVS
jgi:hypothetical protein